MFGEGHGVPLQGPDVGQINMVSQCAGDTVGPQLVGDDEQDFATFGQGVSPQLADAWLKQTGRQDHIACRPFNWENAIPMSVLGFASISRTAPPVFRPVRRCSATHAR